jgi:hypothetical protein
MGVLLSIYLIAAFVLILAPIVLKTTIKTAFFILAFPAMPFLVAYQNRKERPAISKTIFVLYSILYGLFILLCFLP